VNQFLRGSLRHQLYLRLFAAFAFVGIFGGVGILFAYKALVERAALTSMAESVKYVEHNISTVKSNWQKSAQEVKAQIDFMRIFGAQSQEASWIKLRAYFAILEGKIGRFPSGVVLGSDRKLLFAYGTEGQPFGRAIEGNSDLPAWYFSSNHRTAFLPIVSPLWLGEQGNGQLILLQPIDNSVLLSLAPKDSTLLMALNNRVIASSRGSVDLNTVVNSELNGMTTAADLKTAQRILRWIDGDIDAPHLILQQVVTEPISRQSVIFAAIVLLASFTAILWFAIGRWSTQLTQRIEHLFKASEMFMGAHHLTHDVQHRLEQASSHPDEIAKVAASSKDLMGNIESFDQEHFAYLKTLEILEEGVVELNSKGVYLRASPGWERLSNFRAVGGGDLIFNAIHPEDEPDFRKQIDLLFTGEKSSLVGRARLHQPEKKEVWIEYRFIAGESNSKQVQSVSGVLRDITQSYLLEKHISHMALHDALTELPNRILFEDRAKVALRTAKRKGNKVAVAFVDLDHFKNVNDQHGHGVGDQMLVSLASSLKGSLRSGDTLARWGGDEFVVLITDLETTEGARDVMAKFLAVCERPIVINGNQFNVTCSMGVAIYPEDAQDVESMLSQADRAMFFAKEQGRNTVRFVSDMADRDKERRALYIQNLLATAIKDQKLQVWFQPIVDAGTRRVVACEALARWNDEIYGWVPPATFIPMAENLGLIRELGHQIWLKTVESMERWKRQGIELRVAVNVSRRQLFIPSFTADLLDDLAELHLSPSMIDLEITESVAMEDAEHTTNRLAELAGAGFGIAIDDFGTGYSSLSQLHEMPASKVKIDISFVRRVHLPQGEQLIQAIVKIASAFNMNTVAEGVEDEQTAAALERLGVNQLQGYYFAKPMNADQFEAFVLENSN
jgi:diguanylate cyclase (GGDEF)-like protein